MILGQRLPHRIVAWPARHHLTGSILDWSADLNPDKKFRCRPFSIRCAREIE